MAVLLQNCSFVVRSPAQIERDVDILIEGSRIRSIGKGLASPQGTEMIPAHGCAVLPGFINAHTHLYQSLLKGISPDIALVPWCNQVLFPWLGAMHSLMGKDSKRLAYLWTAIASIEMIHAGVTCCVDMDNISSEILHAWEQVGFRGVLAYTLSNTWVPAELRAGEEKMKQQVLSFIQDFHQPDKLTTLFIAPSTVFLCTDDFLLWAGKTAREYNLGMQIHVSETAGEVQDQFNLTGCSPVEHLQHLGLLDENLSAVHFVHVNSHDIDLLAASGAQVVHCPKSNMKLADGIAPTAFLRKKGISVSLGTDGCASNDLLDMWEEMRAALLLSRVHEGQADSLSARDVFGMATLQAARAARIDAGELQPGKLADLAVVDLSAPHLRPLHAESLLNTLVFCGQAADVRDTIINGNVVMRNRRVTTVNEEDLLEEAQASLEELTRLRCQQLYA